MLSVEVHDLLALKELRETLNIKASASNHEAGHACGIDGLLTLLLELEGNLVLDVLLDWLCGHGSALFLNHLQIDGLRVTEEAHNEIGAEEADTLA